MISIPHLIIGGIMLAGTCLLIFIIAILKTGSRVPEDSVSRRLEWTPCSWCRRYFRGEQIVNNIPAGDYEKLSHGICPDCYQKQISELERMKQRLNK